MTTTRRTAYLASTDFDREPCSGLMIQAEEVDDGDTIAASEHLWLDAGAPLPDEHAADELLTAHGWSRVTPWRGDNFGQLLATVKLDPNRAVLERIRKEPSEALNVDINELDHTTRKQVDTVAAAFRMQQALIRQVDVRQRNLEEAMKKISIKTSDSEEELQVLKARLESLERRHFGAKVDPHDG